MIKALKTNLKEYLAEIDGINFIEYNKFIINNLILKLLKSSTLLPIMIALAVSLFSLAIQKSIYIFIPQSSITAYATFTLLNFAISLVTLTIYPILIILITNYFSDKVKYLLHHRIFLPLKVIFLVGIFFGGVNLLMGNNFKPNEKILLTLLWTSLYFLLTNTYLAHLYHKDMLKLSKIRMVAAILFVILLVKPFSFIYIHTSKMINFTSVNSTVYLPQTACKMISTQIVNYAESKNLTTNSDKFFQKSDNGCYLLGNLIRYGFAADYVIMFKKNISPITIDNISYNYYVRLNCYSGNCFAEDNIRNDIKHDLSGKLIQNSLAINSTQTKSE